MFGVHTPYTSPPNSLPIRCSWADGAAVTGLNFTATDISEGVFGDGWTRYLDVLPGQWYTLFLDNWYLTTNGFTLNWNTQGGASIDCIYTPLDLFNLCNRRGTGNLDDWLTSGTHNTGSYRIERSADGRTFAKNGRYRSAGDYIGDPSL